MSTHHKNSHNNLVQRFSQLIKKGLALRKEQILCISNLTNISN